MPPASRISTLWQNRIRLWPDQLAGSTEGHDPTTICRQHVPHAEKQMRKPCSTFANTCGANKWRSVNGNCGKTCRCSTIEREKGTVNGTHLPETVHARRHPPWDTRLCPPCCSALFDSAARPSRGPSLCALALPPAQCKQSDTGGVYATSSMQCKLCSTKKERKNAQTIETYSISISCIKKNLLLLFRTQPRLSSGKSNTHTHRVKSTL